MFGKKNICNALLRKHISHDIEENTESHKMRVWNLTQWNKVFKG